MGCCCICCLVLGPGMTVCAAMQVLDYNGELNVTGWPDIQFPVAGVPFSNASYQGLLFSPNTHPGSNTSLRSFDLIWDRVIAAEGTGEHAAWVHDYLCIQWSCPDLSLPHTKACQHASRPLPQRYNM